MMDPKRVWLTTFATLSQADATSSAPCATFGIAAAVHGCRLTNGSTSNKDDLDRSEAVGWQGCISLLIIETAAHDLEQTEEVLQTDFKTNQIS
jgi:hypothetical protein